MPVFIGIGTVVNVTAIIISGTLGLIFSGGIRERHQQAIVRMLGISTLFISLTGGLEGMETADTLGMILTLVIGTYIGELIDLDSLLERFGVWLKSKADNGGENSFVEGFVMASLVVSVGAMAIVGSLQDALSGDPATLYTKSVLDFVIVMIFASTYGKGAIFSAIPVGVIQGSVTLCAAFLAPVFSDVVIQNVNFIGSLLLFCVGTNLAFNTKFRVANMLPALVVGGLYVTLLG